MLKFWLYIIVLAIFCVIGLTIGSANDTMVNFDFLFVNVQLSLAMVLVVGIIIGIILGIYLSLLICLKFYFSARNAKAELKLYKKNVLKEQKIKEQEKAQNTLVTAADK